jgi:hypothetical protein
MAQLVECLPCKCKTLNSKHRTTKEKGGGGRGKRRRGKRKRRRNCYSVLQGKDFLPFWFGCCNERTL